jgi:hypothetical protein
MRINSRPPQCRLEKSQTYTHTHTHIHIKIHINRQTHLQIHAERKHKCTFQSVIVQYQNYAHTQTYKHTYTPQCRLEKSQTYTQKHTRTHTYIHTQTNIHKDTHTYIHTHIRTHTQLKSTFHSPKSSCSTHKSATQNWATRKQLHTNRLHVYST